MTKQEEIRKGIAGDIFEWCKRNGYIATSLEWKEVTGVTRGLILSITDIVLEHEASQGVVIKVGRELPKPNPSDMDMHPTAIFQLAIQMMQRGGCGFFEPLIKLDKK